MNPRWAKRVANTGLGLFALASAVLGAPSQYVACRSRTDNPLDGCPDGTIVVSACGCGGAQFNTIQSAILSLPHDNSSQILLVLPGSYIEQLNITRPGPVTLLGQTAHPTVQADNEVEVFWAAANVNGAYTDNAYTAVLTVAPTLEASLTGSGNTGHAVPSDTPFGSIQFSAYNINFRNVYAEYGIAQSLAVSISYANAGFYWCGIYSYQDTVSLFIQKTMQTQYCSENLYRYMSENLGMPISTIMRLRARPTSSMVRIMAETLFALVHNADREICRFRNCLDSAFKCPLKRLWRRYHCLEGDKYNVSK